MKLYVPNQLIYALQTVEEEHPLIGATLETITDSALEELVLLINGKEIEELERFASIISRRESNALCRYLGNNVYKVDLKKIVHVISFCMNQGNYTTLFRVWQQFPDCTEALSLLGLFDISEYREANFPVKEGLLKAWSEASIPIAAVAQTSTDLGKGTCFSERLEAIGLLSDSALAHRCYQQFFCQATVSQFDQEGDYKLWDTLCKSEKSLQERILLHLLNFGESAERNILPSFRDTYQKAFALWKEPNSKFFPKENKKAHETYAWWYNYYQMASAFRQDADFRRINYWKQHLHKCTCSRERKHDMLIMDFGQYVVTEFEGLGAVYIFDSHYFNDKVIIKMRFNNTVELKSWLYNYAVHTDRQTHTQRWEYNQTRVLRRYKII